MNGVRTTGKAKPRAASKKPAVKQAAAKKPARGMAGRIMAQQKTIDAMAVKIRRKSKAIAASANRLLNLVA